MPAKPEICHCDSGLSFAGCCQPLLTGQTQAADAKALMRSRYSAFCRADAQYLLRTWHPDTRPESLNLNEDNDIKWVGLKIEWCTLEATQAWVHCIARYKVRGKLERLIETSHFVFQQGVWLYRSGVMANSG